MSDKVIYCWDTNILVAWLREEATAPLGDIELVVSEIDAGAAILLMPVIAYSEVLEAYYTPAQISRFRQFLERSNVEVANITKPIAEKAGQIRNRGLTAKPKRSIKTPDATFIATAIVYKANVLHTLEEGGWAAFSGSDMVDGLKISKPRPFRGTTSLFNPCPSEPPPPFSPGSPSAS